MFCLLVATTIQPRLIFQTNLDKEQTLFGNFLQHREQSLGGVSAQRGEILCDQQMQQFANICETANITNCIAKVQLWGETKKKKLTTKIHKVSTANLVESIADNIGAGHFTSGIHRDEIEWLTVISLDLIRGFLQYFTRYGMRGALL